jgi:plasmid stabilization system protein ParE
MEQLESDDYFLVLGLARDASEIEVRRAYKRLAVQWHPDKNRSHPRAEEFFKKIAEAYAVLSDPEQRRHYEQFGKSGLEGGASGPESGYSGSGPDPFGFDMGFSARHAHDIFAAFFNGIDPFDELFGGGRRQRQRRTADEWNSDPLAAMGFGSMGFGSMGFGNMGFGGIGLGHMGMIHGGSMATMMSSFFGDDGFGDFGSFSTGGGGSFSTSEFVVIHRSQRTRRHKKDDDERGCERPLRDDHRGVPRRQAHRQLVDGGDESSRGRWENAARGWRSRCAAIGSATEFTTRLVGPFAIEERSAIRVMKR